MADVFGISRMINVYVIGLVVTKGSMAVTKLFSDSHILFASETEFIQEVLFRTTGCHIYLPVHIAENMTAFYGWKYDDTKNCKEQGSRPVCKTTTRNKLFLVVRVLLLCLYIFKMYFLCSL